MTHTVILHQFARAELDQAFLWAAKRAPETAARWLDRFQDAIQTLRLRPERCPQASMRVAGFEVFEFHFGRHPYVFRAYFVIDGSLVRILRIRRAQRRGISAKKLRESLDHP